MTTLRDKHILILGLGESGLAMARWCASEGGRVRVADTRSAPPQQAALQASVVNAELRCGVFALDLLDGMDLLAISPGLSPLHMPQQALVLAARERNIPVWGEIELFAQKLADLHATAGYAPRLIAITGTNGKTTVTSLTGKLCQRAGFHTAVAGNISPAALDALSAALTAALVPAMDVTDSTAPDAAPAQQLDVTALPQIWVLELSSFQLETVYSLKPDAATVLNVTQDHLDWHGSMQAYAAAKERIFAAGTVRILNRNDALTLAMSGIQPEIKMSRAARAALPKTTPIAVHTFGTDAPRTPDSFGIVDEGGIRWLALAEAGEDEGRRRRGSTGHAPLPTIKRLMPVDALRIRGNHNAANALAALALCRAIGLPIAPLLHGLRDYAGEPHRVELVMQIDAIDYVDDSKGTNVGATVAALAGLGEAATGKIVLIAGGDGKGQDFLPLAAPVARYARAVMLIGKDGPTLHTALADCAVALQDCSTLPEAVNAAALVAQPGDTVLLSPACASLDMFDNYKHRADVFIAAVQDIALEAGQPC